MKIYHILLIVLFLSTIQARFWTAIIDQNANCWNSANNALGMTWALYPAVPVTNVVHVGCSGCNAYQGDTDCDKCLPILCVQKNQDPRPAYQVAPGQEFYQGWVGGPIQLTTPIKGSDLHSQADGDTICSNQFGAGYVMGEHHDGYYMNGMNNVTYYGATWNWTLAYSGGWTFYGWGNYDSIFKLQSLTDCKDQLTCQNSYFYSYDTTLTPPQWVQQPSNNDFCNPCENLTIYQPVPSYCFNNIVVATLPKPEDGCFACVCNPCDKQYYWFWSNGAWHRKPARDDFCKACLTDPLNSLCHGLNPFNAPGPRDPCEGCWCFPGKCENYLLHKLDATGHWVVSVLPADTQKCALCNSPFPPNFCYQTVADIPQGTSQGCVCSDVVKQCTSWQHYSRGADGTFSINIDNTLCNDCAAIPTPSICFGFGAQFTDVPLSMNDICWCNSA